MVKYIKDYYKIMKIDENSDYVTIEKEYRKARSQHYKTGYYDNKKYRLIEEAYTVLSNPTKKEKYDKLREIALKNMDNKTDRKENNVTNAVNKAFDIEKEYGVISKLLKNGTKLMKSSKLSGSIDLLLGGTSTGTGINNGRNYMKKRNRI